MQETAAEHSAHLAAEQSEAWEAEQHLLKQSASRLKLIAAAHWAADLTELYEAEYIENEQLCGRTHGLQPTTYRARLTGERAEAYDRRRNQQRRDQMAIELHSNNMRHWSPSLLGRSATYFSMTTTWVRAIEGRQRRLASRPTTLLFLRHMRDTRPEPVWERAKSISVFAADQTYEWVGMQKRGHRQALERVDSTGMPMQISHEVYINAIQLAVPAALDLSAADVARIKSNHHGSPYTEPFNLVLEPLRPANVQASLIEFARDVCALTDQVPQMLPPCIMQMCMCLVSSCVNVLLIVHVCGGRLLTSRGWPCRA